MRRGEGKKEVSEGRRGRMEEVRKGGEWIEEGGTCREGGRKYGWLEIK